MNGIKLATHNFFVKLTPRMPPQLEKIKKNIYANPLLNRITVNWKVILMDCGTIIAVTCVVFTFFNGATVFCAAFFILSVSSGVGSFYMRRFALLKGLEQTAKGLRESQQRFETLAKNLERENTRLTQTNQELLQTNEAFRNTNRDLQATNHDLQNTNQAFRDTNTRLTQQVASLTLQVTQLRESAERIRGEVVRFQQENTHLHLNVQGMNATIQALDQQINNSRALCEQITQHLANQHGLGQQLQQLAQYLNELRNNGIVHQRIQELDTLRTQTQLTTQQLNQVQVQYAQTHGQFQALHSALVQLKDQFERSITGAATQMSTNNQEFRTTLTNFQQLLNRSVPGSPPSPLPAAPIAAH